MFIKKHDNELFNEKHINLRILTLLACASFLYLAILILNKNVSYPSKIFILGIISIYFLVLLLMNYIKFFDHKLKYIYPLASTLTIISILYIEKGSIDNIFMFFPVMAFSTLYFQYEVLISATILIVFVNFAGFICNRNIFYPHITIIQFASIIISMILTGALLAYIIKKVYMVLEKAKEEERKAKKALDSLERTLVYLDNAYSKLKETQIKLVQHEKMASLGTLVAGVAHEINNPIGAINCNVDLYKNLISRLKMTESVIEDSMASDLVSKLEDTNKTNIIACDRIFAIVKSLKNFARLDESEFKEADIHTGIDCTLILLDNKLKNRIKVIKEYGNIPHILCYPNQLNQVFMNVLANAIQAVEDTGTIWIKTHLDKNYVYINIKDSGRGMSSETVKRIFDPGFTTKGVGVGTGLGLSIVYNIIEKHKGEINVKSELGEGTEFIIKLPLSVK